MNKSLKSVTIVGGGTAGWLAAGMLFAARNRRNEGDDLEITLIESPRIPTVGVGEATTLSMTWTLSLLALDEKDLLQKCDGSIKAAVKFEDWDKPAAGRPSSYYHPFESPYYIYGYSPAYHYLRRARNGASQPPFAHSMVPSPALLDAGKAPRTAGAGDLEGLSPYSYHIDAGLFAAYMKDYCSTVGVRHILDDVVDVALDERGFVTALELQERGSHPVEFVIDCSGFSGRIIRQALDEPFLSYEDSLPCDRAIAIQTPHPPDSALASYTTSTALGAGWSWKVPLYSRLGQGYVYSSKFRDRDEALAEFLAAAGANADDVNPNFIDMHIGRSRRNWVNNCLAVGLAGGFIEPLESTSIHFVQMSIRWFLDNFPDRDCGAPLRDAYNRLVTDLYEEIRDFIVMHYHLSTRDDSPFWLAMKNDIAVPDRLKDLLERWRYKLPSTTDAPSQMSMFSEWSYLFVLMGKGFFDGMTYPIEDFTYDEDFDSFLEQLGEHRAQLMAAAPDHRELLTQIRAMPTDPWYRPGPAAAAEPGSSALI